MRSLFWRKTRYLASASANPRENCLTEAFASVLERVHDLPFPFLEFLDPELRLDQAQWRARIGTQQRTWSGRVIDLELVFVPRSSPRRPPGDDAEDSAREGKLACWVEIKHGAGLSDPYQLEQYLRDIEEKGATTTSVCLLAPRDSGIEVPERVIQTTWQQWAKRLWQYRRQSAARRADPVEDWLIGQFLTYLREEALMDEERLTVEHAFILSALPGTVGLLSQMWEVIDGHVQKHWGPLGGRAPLQDVNNTYRRYAPHPRDVALAPTWGKTHLHWGMQSDSFLEEPRNSVVFYTGLSVESPAATDNYLDKKENAAWLTSLQQQGFQRVFQWCPRLWRFRYADELLQHGSLDEQSQAMADWVLESFRSAVRTPPPVGAAGAVTGGPPPGESLPSET